MIALEDMVVSDDPEKSINERLASIERGLDRLKAGVEVLSITPCDWCHPYFRRSDPGALFHCSEFVCYDCVPQWWLHRCPELSADDRQRAERELRRLPVSSGVVQVLADRPTARLIPHGDG